MIALVYSLSCQLMRQQRPRKGQEFAGEPHHLNEVEFELTCAHLQRLDFHHVKI